MDRKYQAFIDTINVLNKNNITYDESQDVVDLIKAHINQSRETMEYNSSLDYYKHNKSTDVSDIVIEYISITT